jgi:8-oxo-dGTP pyrophosphatase MutT (NUDIX family)
MAERTKEKPSLVREFSAGGIVFRKKGQGILWLVTKSTPSALFPKEVWRLPKGWLDDVDDGKSPGPLARGKRKAKEKELQQAALREVKEEGGVEAKIVSKIGTERYFMTLSGKKILKFVTFYLMEWQKDVPEGIGWETEEIAWLPYQEARKRLSYSGEKKILDKAKELLGRGIQKSLV